MDPLHLKTFVTVIDCGSFSGAARILRLSQPTVSEHIKRLEQFAGQRLFQRDTHSLALTQHGEAMVPFAKSILDTTEKARFFFESTGKRHSLRFGASEDLVTEWLPGVIRAFTADYPDIDIDFTIALSEDLIKKFEEGGLDIVLCKRGPQSLTKGDLIWREPLVWLSSTGEPVVKNGENQLVLYPPPSITRFRAVEAMARTNQPWRIAFSSSTLNGLAAAARIGLGMMAHARLLAPNGLQECLDFPDLPILGELEFVLLCRKLKIAPLNDLCRAIQHKVQAVMASFPDRAKTKPSGKQTNAIYP
ncbi:LysR family transcriptional regulator [Allorhizobium sp. BGMRC 0089]|uniref:LysR family transcriptional regulator n=1 Tax=Allorhizobium sonneratiae TaxID=2934936 RepID=UPI002034A01B|nr:LysR family transcriptional regulator [Allorhizobium sonneratiae]MCM2292975.1 LysR family transcriptional regulator [Allorhizobium sonneratiae]